MNRILITTLAVCLLAAGCDDEREALRAQNELQSQHVSTLSAENAALLEAQSKSLGELQTERERSSQILAEDRALRNHRDLGAAVIVLLACALAASLYALAHRRKERDVPAR